MKTYYVYKILKGGSIIYIGCTCNVVSRAKNHQKVFGHESQLIVIDKYYNKQIALQKERKKIFECISNGDKLYNIHGKYGSINPKYFSLRIRKKSTYKLLKKEAKLENITINELINNILRNYLKKDKDIL